MKRVAIFIDGNNFYFGLKKIYPNDTKFINFNFEKFCSFLTAENKLVAIFYYNAPLDRTKDLEKYQNQQRFFEKLKKIPKLNLVLCKLLKRRIRCKRFSEKFLGSI